MKKLFWKSRIFVRVLSMGIIILVSVSCSSTRSMPVVQSNDTLHFTQKSAMRDTIYLHDSVFFHDSVVYRERTIHDTVYITKEVYRDALNSKFKIPPRPTRSSLPNTVTAQWSILQSGIYLHFTSIAPLSSLLYLQQELCTLLANGILNLDCNSLIRSTFNVKKLLRREDVAAFFYPRL